MSVLPPPVPGGACSVCAVPAGGLHWPSPRLTVPRSTWSTICVQADGGVRVHLKEDTAKRGAGRSGDTVREKAWQRTVWLTGKNTKRFTRIFFFHEKRVRTRLKGHAMLAWCAFCQVHMRENPQWVRPQRQENEEGWPEAKCESPPPAVDSVAGSEGKDCFHHQCADSTATLASNNTMPVTLTAECKPSDASSSPSTPPTTRSKAGQKKKKK